jgi:two-component system LytT family response regulator
MNNLIRTIIVDDELDGRLVLSSLLSSYCKEVQLLGTFENALSAIQAIKMLKPDLVFLDIEMPGMNAFAMLEQIAVIDFEVVFVTAYDSYALKAIKHNALEYILKPVDKSELVSAIEKYLYKKSEKIIPSGQESGNSRMALAVREGFLFIDVAKIVRCEGDGNYTNVYLDNNEKYLASKTLKEFELALPASSFIRIHKSHLINSNFIKKYIKSEGGIVVMADNTELEVSRRNKEYFMRFFNLKHT